MVCPVCSGDVSAMSFCPSCISVDCNQNLDFMAWLNNVWQSANAKQKAEAVTMCCALWRAMNDLVWNQKYSTVNKVVAAAKQYLTQWTVTQNRSYVVYLQPQVNGYGASSWVKPQPNKVKVSVDAAIFETREKTGLGLVARDSEGEIIEVKTICLNEQVSPVLAEVMAIKEALSWIDKKRWPAVQLESDCLAAIQAIRCTTPMRSRFGAFVEDCRQLMNRINNVELLFVKRYANMVAHRLARESCVFPDRSFNRWSIPNVVKDCLMLDLIS